MGPKALKRIARDVDQTPRKRARSTSYGGKKLEVLADKSNTMLQSPPVTPEKQRIVTLSEDHKGKGNDSCKRRLALSTPPTTPTKSRTSTVYTKAKALFQRGSEDTDEMHRSCLVGREREGSQLNQFLLESIQQQCCNSLYICGPPGTGKSAQVNLSFKHVSQEAQGSGSLDVYSSNGNKFKIIRINCMSLSKPENIFHEIYCGLDGSGKHSTSYAKHKTADDLFQLLMQLNEARSAVVLLDEMDRLITKDQQVLFQVFSFASKKNTRVLKTKLVLICISNALDLVDKFLPSLKRNALSPESLQFLPYTAEQIKEIITFKLKSLVTNNENKENIAPCTSVPIIHPVAIQLCCKKSASVTGDLRKAFDICYKSIEIVEGNARREDPMATYTFDTAPKVQISHIAKVCEHSFKDNSLSKLKSLNLMLKTVLCCLFVFQSKQAPSTIFNKKEVTVNSFFDFYIKYSKDVFDKLLGTLKKSDFLDVISNLEATSVVNLSDSRAMGKSMDIGNKFIKTNVPYDDLVKSIGEVGILRKVLLI